MKKISSLILRISITAALLIFLFLKTDFKSVLKSLESANLLYLLGAFAFYVFLNFLIILRWHLLLSGLSIKLPFSRTTVSYLESLFINLIFPSTIGGDTARTIDIARHSKKHSSGVLATVILDRVGGFCGLITVLGVSLFFGYRVLNDPNVLIASLIFLGLILFLGAIAFSGTFFNMVFKRIPFKNLKDYLYQLHQATSSYKKCPQVLLMVWLLSIVIQGGLSLIYYWVALSIGVHLPLVYFFIFVPVVTVISVIPVSVGGLGIRDGACITLFARAGMLQEQAFAVSLSNFVFLFTLGVFGGLVYVIDLYRRRL